ncbi:MAG TPA: peptidyl-prolyl cis-trans isomerase [Gemmatales bacterium]|nr:peptidyl-prolyl cis-trans isomerase [Gemmatales bacterium]
MKTGHLLSIAGWAFVVMGCCSHSVLAQGKGDVLLPPAGSLPLGTGNTAKPGVAQAASTDQAPSNIQQTGNNIPKGVVKSRVIARVNGSPILEEEIFSASQEMIADAKKRIAEQYWPQLEQELRMKSLNDLILAEAIIQDAAVKVPKEAIKRMQEVANKEFDKMLRKDKEVVKLKNEEQLKEYFNNQGKSIDLMRRQFIRGFIASTWIRELCRDLTDQETTRERLLEYYRNNPQDFLKKERVVWQHIYIDVDRYANAQSARQVAETVWQLLRNAKTDEEFNAIVNKYADGVSKARSGSGEGNFRGEIKPTELERFVFEQPGGGQGPVVETSRGYHVFRVKDHTPEEMLSFEKVCIELKRKMEDKIYDIEFNRLSKGMREKATVEIMDKAE